jgi:hypothetical protein
VHRARHLPPLSLLPPPPIGALLSHQTDRRPDSSTVHPFPTLQGVCYSRLGHVNDIAITRHAYPFGNVSRDLWTWPVEL